MINFHGWYTDLILIIAIEAMAEYALYEYHSSRWNSRDSAHFIDLCKSCMHIIAGIAHTTVAPRDGSESLRHFKEVMLTLSEVLDHLKEDSTGMEPSDAPIRLISGVYAVVFGQPSLRQDLRKCVESLVALHTYPHTSIRLPEEASISDGLMQGYRDELSRLCGMYNLHCPKDLPLLSKSCRESSPSDNCSNSTTYLTVRSDTSSQDPSADASFDSPDGTHHSNLNSTDSQGPPAGFRMNSSDHIRNAINNATGAQSSCMS